MNRGNILLIDDEGKLRQLLKRIISLEGFIVLEADSLKTALRMLEREHVEVILCDVKLPDGDGIDFIEKVKSKYPQVEMIMLTAYGNISDGVRSIQRGAFDYLTKGNDNERIIPLLDRAMEKFRLRQRVEQLEQQVKKRFTFETILGKSEQIREAIAMAERVAPTDASVLLLGETGTGKEVFAQAIHQASKRSGMPFVALNVSSFSKELLESELFGHLSGAFTSAVKDKKGLIEEADGGTLFLDEIGEMAFDLQAKLLRVLETSEFIKVGDTKSTRVSVRIITATNRDLQKEVNEGKFREDLFYRLNIFTITLPSLAERKEDIPLLADHFLHLYASKTNGRVNSMNSKFIDRLLDHEWKGNIRELKNIIERAVILSNTSELTPANLPIDFHITSNKTHGLSAFELASMEKLHIQRVLNYTKGNKMAAAKLLNIGLTTLYRKIEEYQLIEKN
ncbi:MAG: sigma-54 dependent transcriptional regulator [Bacteroidota bacterium]|nr:sigma-54 dependent transcriptional regulator [Bacteroidota bacterium]